MTTKPTYEELAQAILLLEEAWGDLFGQVVSNPVRNAWGKPVDFTAINIAREKTSGLVYRLNHYSVETTPLASEPPRPTLQQYLQDSDDQGYNMKDMLLEQFVAAERRRMSKSGEDETGRSLYYEVEEKINNEIPLVDVLQAVFHVFERVAKGDTTCE